MSLRDVSTVNARSEVHHREVVFESESDLHKLSATDRKMVELPSSLCGFGGMERVLWDGGRWAVCNTFTGLLVVVWDLHDATMETHYIERYQVQGVHYFKAAGAISAMARCGKMVALGLKTGKVQIFHVKKIYKKSKGGRCGI